MADKAPDNTLYDEKTDEKFSSKRPGEYVDPCQDAAAKSLRCLHRNGGNRELCSDYFQAYRDCKAQWMRERAEAKAKSGKSWFS